MKRGLGPVGLEPRHVVAFPINVMINLGVVVVQHVQEKKSVEFACATRVTRFFLAYLQYVNW